MTDEEHVIHGEKLKVPVPKVSVGIQLHQILKENGEKPLLIDVVTNKKMLRTTLLSTACRLAQSLQNYGLQKNDIIAVCSENSIYYYNPVLAGLFSGITVTTFSSHYTEGELIHVAHLSQPTIIFCSLHSSATVFNVIDKLKTIPKIVIMDQTEDYMGCSSIENFILQNLAEDFDENSYEPVPVNINDDVAFVLYSSGTSGLPKGVMLTHLNVNSILALYLDGSFSETTTPLVSFLPFFHAYGLLMVFKMILFRSCVLVMKKFDLDVYLHTLEKYKIDYLQLVPPVAQYLAKTDDLKKYDLSSVKTIYCGAAPLSKDIEDILCKRFNTQVRQGYGLTECTLAVIGHLRDKSYPSGSVGDALPGTSFKIVDVETGRALGPMKHGEIWCRGNTIMKGYLNNPEETANVIDSKGWLHTGDIGYYDHNNVFYIVDRIKELIKCKGYQVAPAELESILVSHPKIADAAVIGIPDEKSGEVPFGFIVKVENQTLSEKEVEDFIAGKVAPYKRLRGGIKFVSEIPKSPSGKILRRLLRDQLKNLKSKL